MDHESHGSTQELRPAGPHSESTLTRSVGRKTGTAVAGGRRSDPFERVDP